MPFPRIIGRLDVKGNDLIKGVQLEGLRKLGDPNSFAKKYYKQGIDELIYIDSVASLYGRNNLLKIVQRTTKNVFIPVTVGGGIRNLNDISLLLKSGADKVAINSEAIRNPIILKEAAEKFGSQCIVSSIVAKKHSKGWEVYIDGGRERTGVDAIEWAKKVIRLGAGEILVTSVDNDGCKIGFDVELIELISKDCPIPITASGGAGKKEHLLALINRCNVNAIAIGTIFHFNNLTIKEAKQYLKENNIQVRENNEY